MAIGTAGTTSILGGVAWTLRSAAVATTSYVATSHMPVGESGQCVMFVVTCASVDYTSIETIVQFSQDGSVWIDAPNAAGSMSASYTLANLSSATDGSFAIIARTSGLAVFTRVMLKRTGGTAVGTVAVTGYVSKNTL